MIVFGAVLLVLLLWETAHPFFAYFRERPKDRGKHLLRNFVIGAINNLLIAGIFVSLWLAAAVWAEEAGFGLLNVLADAGMPTWAHVAGSVVVLDAWMYLWHRINHELPVLWRFHRVHHSDNRMDVSTASRFHVGEIALSSALRILVIVLGGLYVWELVLYETAMFAVVQFHHANLSLPAPVDQALRTVIVSPNMHKIHHSRWQPETDSNYSSLFSFWDRIFGTYRTRRDYGAIDFGLDGYDDEGTYQSVWGMLRTPVDEPGGSAGEEPEREHPEEPPSGDSGPHE